MAGERETLRANPSMTFTGPEWLEWSDVLSILAVLLAGIPLLQRWLGKPKPKVEFTKDGHQHGVDLRCEITNRSVNSRALKVFGVKRRAAQHLGVFATIRTGGTGDRVAARMKGLIPIERPQRGVTRVPLHSGAGVSTPIIVHDYDVPQALIPDEIDDENHVLIDPGEYVCEIKVSWEDDSLVVRRRFIVEEEARWLRWE